MKINIQFEQENDNSFTIWVETSYIVAWGVYQSIYIIKLPRIADIVLVSLYHNNFFSCIHAVKAIFRLFLIELDSMSHD